MAISADSLVIPLKQLSSEELQILSSRLIQGNECTNYNTKKEQRRKRVSGQAQREDPFEK